MVKRSSQLITVVLAVFVIVVCCSVKAFAARTTVTVTNNTPYPLRAIYKAVGCVHIYHSGNGQTGEVCTVKDVAPLGGVVSYEFGGGTSGRKVWAEIVSGTEAFPPPAPPEMMISTDDQGAINHWNSEYAGRSAIIGPGYTNSYDLTDRNSNSCAVKGFGILHDAHVTWNKLEVQKVALVPPEVDPAITLFIADCGVTVVGAPEATRVCVPFDEKGKARINDGLFDGNASTSSSELAEFCMSLVEPDSGQPGAIRFLIGTEPSDVSGSCEGSVVDADRIKVTCGEGHVTNLEGRVKVK